MEESWRRFIFTARRKLKRNAASPSEPGSPAALIPDMSPASPVKINYADVSSADAIAELCVLTGDEYRDYVHGILIDLIQRKLIRAVRFGGKLCYLPTDAGHEYINQYLGEAVDEFLEVMFRDK